MFESLLKDQVQGLMGILGQQDGLAPVHTYVSVEESSYDTSVGEVIDTETHYPEIPMVLARYSSEEIDDDKVVVTDQKAIFAANDLPVTPKVQDRIILTNGTVHMIMDFKGVPGGSVWIVQLRETS